jgi:hypothetical protein
MTSLSGTIKQQNSLALPSSTPSYQATSDALGNFSVIVDERRLGFRDSMKLNLRNRTNII